MRKMISKTEHEFLKENKNFIKQDKENNATEIGNNVEIDGDLEVNGSIDSDNKWETNIEINEAFIPEGGTITNKYLKCFVKDHLLYCIMSCRCNNTTDSTIRFSGRLTSFLVDSAIGAKIYTKEGNNLNTLVSNAKIVGVSAFLNDSTHYPSYEGVIIQQIGINSIGIYPAAFDVDANNYKDFDLRFWLYLE